MSAAVPQGRNDAPGLFELGRAVASQQDLPRVLDLAIETAAAALGADDVFLFVTGEGSGASLSLRACRHREHGAAAGPAHALQEMAAGRALEALRQEASVPPIPGTGPHFEPAPLFVGDRPLGALVAVRNRPASPFSDSNRHFLRSTADYVTVALQSAQLYARQQHRVRELMLLSEIAHDAAELGLDRFFPVVTERICGALGVGLAALLFLDSDPSQLVWGWGHRPGVPIPPTRRRYQAVGGFVGRALEARQPRRGTVEDIVEPVLRTRSVKLGLKHYAAIPLLVRERVVGILLVGRTDRPVDEDELRVLGAVGLQVAVAADNARLLSETEHRAADLALIQSVSTAMARSLDQNAILKDAMERLYAALECDGIRIYLNRGTEFEVVMGGGPLNETLRTRTQDGYRHPVIVRTLAAGQAVEMTLADVEPGEARDLLESLGVGRLAAAPLGLKGARGGPGPENWMGFIILGRKANRVFGPSELSVLNAVAGQLSMALRNAELYEETRRRAEDLAIVNDAGKALLAGEPFAETLEEVAGQIARSARVSACTFLLVDAERARLTSTVPSPGVGTREVSCPLDSDFLAARAVRTRAPQSQQGGTERQAPAAEGLEAMPWAVALPLQSQGLVLGVMVLVDAEAGRELTPSEIARFTAVGNQVALAIDRARLTQRLEKSLIQLEEAQEQFIRRERLAALGGLAALVAHEVRNPLGVIVNSLGFLGKLADLTGDARRAYDIIREETGRLDKIVTDMLDYTRPTEPRLVPASLDRVLREAVASATAAERNRGTRLDGVRTEVFVSPGLPQVPMDDRLLHQALVNLLSNAYQSLNGQGTVRVDGTIDEGGRHVRIAVADDGPGLTEEARLRLWEPFYTTKAKGSGLGLAVVKRIIESHRGDIAVETATGQGTRFVIDLPLARSGTAEEIWPRP